MQEKSHVLFICYTHLPSFPLRNFDLSFGSQLRFYLFREACYTRYFLFNLLETCANVLCLAFFSECLTYVSYSNWLPCPWLLVGVTNRKCSRWSKEGVSSDMYFSAWTPPRPESLHQRMWFLCSQPSPHKFLLFILVTAWPHPSGLGVRIILLLLALGYCTICMGSLRSPHTL